MGIVGAGGIGRVHAENIRTIDGVCVSAVMDMSATRAAELAGACGARAFTELPPMLDEVDVVYVCSPPTFHREHVVAVRPARTSSARSRSRRRSRTAARSSRPWPPLGSTRWWASTTASVRPSGVSASTTSSLPQLEDFDDSLYGLLHIEGGAAITLGISWSSPISMSSRGVVGSDGATCLIGPLALLRAAVRGETVRV